MGQNKKVLELDARVEAMIDEEFSDFEKYLPTQQDKQMYERKRREYWRKVHERLKEDVKDGRADDTGGSN